jgi:hypothetical protein
MSYTIKKSDGTTLATVPENDIVLDKASVALIGRGSTNYGIKHSEAFVHLLENFAHTTPPAFPLEGQLWFDKSVGALKVYKGTTWTLVGSGGGVGGGGPVSVTVGTTNVIAMVAGGKIVMVIASKDIPNGDLPVSIEVLGQTVAFRAEFPFGLEAGTTLSPLGVHDYIHKGRVPEADQAIWAGGGVPFAATTFLDLGPNSVALTVSNNVLIAAYSQVAIPNSNLPTNFVVNNISMPFRAAFPNGLVKGLSLATGMGIASDNINGGSNGGSVTTEIVADMIDDETQARASAVTDLYAYVNGQFATAGSVTSLEAAFKSGTGQSTVAEAIDYLIVSATEGTANAEAGTTLRAEFTNAITGATSFANALQILNTAVSADYATAADITALRAELSNDGEIPFAVSNAMQKLLAQTTGVPKVSVKAATTVDIVLAGAQTIDGQSVVVGDRVLVKNQGNAANNGIYVVASGSWTRAADADTWLELPATFVMVSKGTTLAGTAWVCTSSVNGTLGTTPVTWERRDINTALAQFKTELNTEFETETGYTSFSAAVQDLQASSGSGGSTAAFDTDLRTRFTNAMQNGESAGTIQTIAQAMDKFKNFSGSINTNNTQLTDLLDTLKSISGLTGTVSMSTAAQKLISESKLDTSLSQFRTTLTADYVQAMNDVTGGTGTTFASAITDVVATATSSGSGSSSSVDTTLRNLFISGTHEANHPVTTISGAITKLMTNTTADRAAAVRSEQLETIFTSGLGTTLGSASSKLATMQTQASAAAAFETSLKSDFSSATGLGSISDALSKFNTGADQAGTVATDLSSLKSAFTNTVTGSTSAADAITKLWTKANETGSAAGWGFELNAGNQIVGLQAVADSAQKKSEIAIRADNFKFWHPDTADIVPFEIVGNNVYIKNLMVGNGSLGYEKLQQMTFTSEVFNGSGITVGTSFVATSLAVTTGAVPAGTKVLLFLSANCTGNDSGGVYINIRRNDGVYCRGTAEFGNPDEGGSAQSWTWTDTVPSDGTWTYTAHAKRFGSSSTMRTSHIIGLISKQAGSTAGSGAGGTTPADPGAGGGGGYYDPNTGGYTSGGSGFESGTFQP